MKQIKRMQYLIAVVTVVTMLGGAGNGYAFHHDDERGGDKKFGDRGKKMEALLEDLDLTADQKAQIKERHTAEKEKHKGQREQMKAKREELRVELEQYEINEAKVNALIDELTALHKAKLQQRVDGILAMREILTKEQVEALNEKIKLKHEERKEKRKGMRKHRE